MKEEKEILRGITDFITGEVIPIYEGDKVSITRRETIDYLKNTIEINKNKEFVMSFNIPFRTLAKLNLKSNEYDILMVMLSFLGCLAIFADKRHNSEVSFSLGEVACCIR